MPDHLTRERLLRYLDGELSRSAMAETSEHVQSCWSCRVELERLEEDIATILDAHNKVFVPSLPEPPRPWCRIETRIQARERSSEGSNVWRQIATMAAAVLKPPVASASAALIVLLILSLISLPVRPLSAQEVLHQMELSDARRLVTTPREAIRQRVRVRKVERRSLSTESGTLESWKAGNANFWNPGREGVNSELLERYKANGIPMSLPLSSMAIECWTRLAGSTPVASREYDGAVKVLLVSSASARARGLDEVSFRVQPQDWRVDELQLGFSDAVFEITEESLAIVEKTQVPRNVLAVLDPADPSLRAAVVSPSPHPVPRLAVAPNLEDLEISVRYALHSIGADMGEVVEVTHAEGQVVVNAWPLSPDRKSELAEVLGGKPSVRLELQPPEEPALPKVTVVLPTVPPQAPDQRLTKFFGSPEAEENYVSGILQSRRELLAHLYALRALALRWPSDGESHLSPAARDQLSSMVKDHAAGARLALVDLRAALTPLLEYFGYSASPVESQRETASWQDAATAALETGRVMERALLSLLTASDQPAHPDEALPSLQRQLQELERIVKGLPASGT